MVGTDAGIEFVRMDSDYYVDDTDYPRRTYDLHCPGCGRYCKHVRSRHVYNGNWKCAVGGDILRKMWGR